MQFLVILRVKPGIPNEQIGSLVKPEAQKVWSGIKSGLVRQIWYFTDTEGAIGGAIGIGEAADEQKLQRFIEQLPMVQGDVLAVEVMPLQPYIGLESLFAT